MSDDLVLLLHLAGIVVLLAASAFFSGSETALTAASRARMHQLETHGLQRAGIVNRLREQKERLIGALLLGNTLVNILASSLATSLLVSVLGAPAVPVATVVMTALILIFSEVLPKTYAINHADRAALSIAPAVETVVRLLGPVVRLVNWLVRGVLRLFGADPSRVGLADYVDELRGAIELHRGSEAEVAQERQMLRSILDLGDVSVAEIMTHRRSVQAIDAELTPPEVVTAMLNSPHTRMPLCQGAWRTSSACCTPRTCCGHCRRPAATRTGWISAASRPSPGSSRIRPACWNSCTPSAPGASISPSWSTSMAACRAW